MQYNFDHRIKLHWVEVFVNSFHLMVALVRYPNKLHSMSESYVHGDNFDSYVKIRILGRLLVNDAIQGMYQTASKLGALHAGEWYRLLAGIYVRDRAVGIIEYSKVLPKQTHLSRPQRNFGQRNRAGSEVNQTNIPTSLDKADLKSRLNSVRPSSAWATSLEDPRLRIYYEFESDIAGGCQMFMAIMDALAIASAHLPTTKVTEPLTAIGTNQHGETHLRFEPSDAPGVSFTWTQLVQALVVFWEQVIFAYHERIKYTPRWNVLDVLLVQYEGLTVAYGVMTIRRFGAGSLQADL